MIYFVGVITKSPKRKKGFFFTDKSKAEAFYDSVKKSSKALDYYFCQISPTTVTEYDEKIKDCEVVTLDEKP